MLLNRREDERARESEREQKEIVSIYVCIRQWKPHHLPLKLDVMQK